MMRSRSLASFASLLALASTGLAGCADNDSGLYVRGVLAIQAPDCVATADPSAAHLLGGVYDISIRGNLGYTAALLVGNQLVRRGDRDQLRTETSRVSLEGAEVTLLTETGSSITEFTVPGTGFVDPGTSDEPGYGVMAAMLIPPGVGSDGTRIVVEVRVFGTTLGGDEIESATLTFPITVCSGCLVTYPVEAIDPITGQCVLIDGQDPPDPPCRPGQDDPVDCRLLGAQAPSTGP
jgi:hypothetical protein